MANLPSPYPLIRNMRTYVDGRIDTRSGLALITAAGTDPIHSLKRLNNDIPSLAVQNSRIIGAGFRLYAQVSLAGALILIDTGYSGNPLSILQMRPPNSPEAWAYIADSLKMSKVRADGTRYQMGIAAPLTPPTATFGPDAVQIIEAFSSVGSWVNGGTAGAITHISTLNALTIGSSLAIAYDNPVAAGLGLPTEASIPGGPSAFFPDLSAVARPGSILAFYKFVPLTGFTFDQNAIIHDVLPGFTCTVQSIQLIATNTGGFASTYCAHLGDVTLTATNKGFTPQMDTQPDGSTGIRAPDSATSKGISVHTLIQFQGSGGVTYYAQIQSIASGPDGSVSIIFSVNNLIFGVPDPPNTSTFLGLPTIRLNVRGTIPNNGKISSDAFSFSVNIGTGFISEAAPFDLSHISTTTIPPIRRSVQDSDTINIAIQMDHPEFLVEGRILFDVDGTTNDFAHNYFFKAFRASDLQQAVLSNQTVLGARQNNLNTAVIDGFGGRGAPSTELRRVGPTLPVGKRVGGGTGPDDPIRIIFGPGGRVPVSNQAATGAVQWTVLSFRVSDLTRVGSDTTKTLQNVQAVRIQFQVNATIQFLVSSLWIGGSYGPDIGTTGSPYFYRHIGRSTKTGAKSNPGPPMMNGVLPRRQAILLALPIHPDPQVDVLDGFRWGGTLTNWIYVGTTPNTGTPQLIDVFQDLDIAAAAQLELDNFQPFPTIDTPKNGTCNVVGNQITWVSGDQFNVNWAQGVVININGLDYHFYTQPTSATALALVENGGTQTGVPFSIKEATILSQPLPVMWGPFSQNSALFCFACGDQFQPGVLFLTKGNNPDSAPDILQIEVTSPSEPLMNGCIHNGLPYCWSSARFFILYPAAQGGFIISNGQVVPVTGTNIFTPQDITGAKGLFARWWFCAGPGIPKIWYGADDGIYESAGGATVSITDEMLYLLFPHDGQPGVPVTLGSDTIQPPDFTQAAKLRLSYADGFLFFDYVDINGLPTTLVYNVMTKVWGLDVYALAANQGVLTHYLEEGRGVHSLLAGGSDANLYQMSGVTDNANPIIAKSKMPAGPDSETYEHIRDCYVGLIVNGTPGPSLVINIDGTDHIFVLPSTAMGTYQKIYQVLGALKGKLFSWGITNEFQPNPFTLFRNDFIARTKEWGSSGSYKPTNPFADLGKRSRIQAGA